MRRFLSLSVAVTAFAIGPVPTAGAGGPAAAAVPVTDFNHDGYADLAVGAPGGDVGGKDGAGYLTILYGSSAGVRTARPQVVSRASAGVPGAVADYDGFGATTAARDFDGDGYTDLVVASTNGPTVALWGSATGLKGGVALDVPEHSGPLAAGDVDGDGHDDLVLGTGLVGVEFGPISRAGVSAGRTVVPFEDAEGEEDRQARYDFVVGDVTGDGADDIVTNHGAEDTLYSGRLWKGGKDRSVTRVPGAIAPSSGGVIADFDRDGHGDFATFTAGTNSGDADTEPGTVSIRYGSPSGLSARRAAITQSTAGVPGADEPGDGFGRSLAAGDVTGDGYPDLAVGVPGEAIGKVAGAGGAVLLRGGPKGVTGAGATAFSQSTAGVPGASETGDHFGGRVLLADVNANDRADLVVAAPYEDAPQADSGAVWVLRGSKNGPITGGIASFAPAGLGAPGTDATFGVNLAR
ncbi:FG-GAP repeat protein [Streptomyces sp. NPDC060194]|uniref:FG-GAP repeat protein n=1 Tax=Streptomyces sp. NPDC060194 TaxID=3347069 RepID=UPI0036537339